MDSCICTHRPVLIQAEIEISMQYDSASVINLDARRLGTHHGHTYLPPPPSPLSPLPSALTHPRDSTVLYPLPSNSVTY